MAKNLIDGNSYEFIEGAEKTEHEALDSRVQTLEGQNLDSRIETLEGQNLDSRITEHTENEDIHLTAAEKAFIDKPYKVFTYTGNGQTLRTIGLGGYNPDLVFIGAYGLPQFDYQGGNLRIYSGWGSSLSPQIYTPGCFAFNGTDIDVYNMLTDPNTNTTSMLNINNQLYVIVAFKFLS